MSAPLRSARTETPLASARGTVHVALQTAPEGESRAASARRAYEALEDKARALCTQERPVTFTVRDWDIPQPLGLDVLCGFSLHGKKRIRLRISKDSAVRFAEALRLAASG